METLNLLVVGECGDGKSTLVKHLNKGSNAPEVGMSPDGVTKNITKYPAGTIRGRTVTLLDTPGVGDTNITVGKLVATIENFLANDKVNGVLLCSSISKLRVTLGAKVVAMLAQKGFVGGQSKWGGFILVGTQADRCKKKEIDSFKEKTLNSLNTFCTGEIDKVCTTKLDLDDPGDCDASELFDCIAKLPGQVVEYVQPSAKDLGDAIGAIMDVPPQIIEKEIVKYRASTFDLVCKQIGKGALSGVTMGMLGWDADTPVFGLWNTTKQTREALS